MSILDELNWRGLLTDCTDATELQARLQKQKLTLYAGFDPTADSLHVGNLIPLLTLRRFQEFGHTPVALAGGATGLIGDPSGKTAERRLLSRDALLSNINSIKQQLRKLLDFNAEANPARLVDNADWFTPVSYLEFLRDIGKHFSINQMIAKESVRARMEDRESGISYTEFSYMLLQAYDFYHLKRELDCSLQIGGSDQWGNITAGIDLCRRKLGETVFGLTLPLLTNADGSKFGKSIDGAVWLDTDKTCVYKFYQFWIRTDDRDVVRFLKLFTFLNKEEIDLLAEEHLAKPEARKAHQALAHEMTALIHGETAAREAAGASRILFGGTLEGISETMFREITGEVPSTPIPASEWNVDGIPLIELLIKTGLCKSKGQARKDIQGGGIYINNERISDPQLNVGDSSLLFGKYTLLRKGKKYYNLLILE